MSGVLKIEITEEAETLKILLNQQKTATGFARVQTLYLLKTKQVETVQHLSVVLARERTTIQRWLRLYRNGGLKLMLEKRKSSGRPAIIPDWAIARLTCELKHPEGFSSYGEVQVWLEADLGIQAAYDVVHNLVHDKLKASLKVARPKSNEQEPEVVEAFKKNFRSN